MTYLSAARAGIYLFIFVLVFFSSYLGISRRLLALLLVYSCRLSSFIKNSVSGAGRGGSVQGAKSAGCSGIVLPPSCQVGLLLASPLGARKARRKRRRDKERGRRWRKSKKKQKNTNFLPSSMLGLLVSAFLNLCYSDIFREVDGGIFRAFYWIRISLAEESENDKTSPEVRKSP